MVRLLALLVALGFGTAALAQKPKILVAPVDVLDSKPLPSLDKKGAQIEIGRAIEQHIAQKLFEGGMDTVKALQADQLLDVLRKGVKGDAIKVVEMLEERAAAAGADFILFAQVVRWNQKNRSMADILKSPGGTASETKVEIRLWLYNRKDPTLISDGNRMVLEGTFNGTYIGTQKAGELTGNPEDVAYAITQVNRLRLGMIARAAGAAVKTVLEKLPR